MNLNVMTVINAFVVLFIGLFVVGIAGCSSLTGENGVFHGKRNDYLKAGELRPVILPEGMKSASLEPLYVIPAVDALDEFGDQLNLTEFEVPRPDPINIDKGTVGVKLQKLGERKWIFLNASTSQVWPRTQNFLSQYGISVASSNPLIGLIETSDVLFKSDPDQISRFKIFIEKGIHPETTEIHILHMQFEDGTPEAELNWPVTSTDMAKERELLDELASVLAESVDNNSASLLGQSVGGDVKAKFVAVASEPTLRLRFSSERALATLTHALAEEGFVVWEKSDKDNVFYVGFNESYREGKRSFIGRMFEKTLPQKSPYSLAELLKSLSDSAEVKTVFGGIEGVAYGAAQSKAQGYLVVVAKRDEGSDVIIRDVRGQLIKRQKSKKLLRTIRKNLI